MLPITIVVASYNRSHLLRATLDSLSRQSSTVFRVVLVDHGSVDDTRDVAERYRRVLPLEYRWLPREGNAPGTPKDVGASTARTPLLAFLDCGVVVPSSYVAAHSRFHAACENRVGVGMFHGHTHNADELGERRWVSILERIPIDEAAAVAARDPSLADTRAGLDLRRVPFPWVFGWGGNLSVRTADYRAVGGFDADQGYGFDDLDLCYRLHKRGLRFDVVEEGWGVHLPHPRPSPADFQRMQAANWSVSYRKQRSCALESLKCAGMNVFRAEEVLRYLTGLGRTYERLPAPWRARGVPYPRPSLLVGGTVEDQPYFDHVAVADENVASTAAIWSCSGVLIPLGDESLETVVVSAAWDQLGYSAGSGPISLLECLVSEIRRTARTVYFVDPSTAANPRRAHASFATIVGRRAERRCAPDGSPTNLGRDRVRMSVATLDELCRRYGLAYELVAP